MIQGFRGVPKKEGDPNFRGWRLVSWGSMLRTGCMEISELAIVYIAGILHPSLALSPGLSLSWICHCLYSESRDDCHSLGTPVGESYC